MPPNHSRSDAQLVAVLPRLASLAAVLTAVLAALVLAGWAFNLGFLKSPLPGQASMKPLAALGLLLGAAALWFLPSKVSADWRGRLALICAGVMTTLGAINLLEYILGVDLGIDQVLFRRALLAENVVPIGRPAPATALCLLLLGLAVLTLDSRPAWLSAAATLCALLVGGLAVMGYAYDVAGLYQIGPYVSIALHTALAIVLLALGLLAARPSGPILGVLTTSLAGSVLGRRLLAAVFVVPFVLGLLRLYGQRLGLYDTGFGVALLVTSNVVIFAALVYASARLLNQSEASREAASDARRLTEENLRLLLDSIKDHAIFMLDTEGRVATWNAAAERIKGYTAAEIIGQPVSVFYPPEEAAAGKAQRALQVAVAEGATEEEGYRVRKDGSRFWAIADTAALRDEHGVLRGYSKVTRDITERKQAESALHEREERLRVLADATPNGLIIVADSGEITWANQRAEVLFGFGHGQLIGRSIDELVPRHYRSGHLSHRAGFAADRRVRLMGAGRDLYGQRQDGIEFPVEIGLSPVETSQGKLTLASIIDITERMNAEAALRLSEERFAKAFRASPAALTVTRLADGRFVDVNAQYLEMFGYERDEVIGQTSTGLGMFPDPAERMAPVQRLQTDGMLRNQEMTLLTKSREQRNVIFSTAQIELDGEAHAVAILIDNTERKRAEAALRDSQARLAGVIDSAMDAIITIGSEQRVQLFNAAAERMFQYPAAAVIGQPIEQLIPERFRAVHSGHIRRFGETGVTNRAMGALGALSGQRADGSEFPIEASISQVEVQGLSIYTVILRDISERRRAEAEIQALNQDLERRVNERTAQLAAANRELSEFAYVVSHDLKAPLRAIGSLANWLVEDYGDKLGEEGREQLHLLDGRVKRLRAMVDSILSYSRVGRVREEHTRVDLNGVVANVLDLLDPPAHIAVTVASDLPVVLGEPTRLQQVFQNLLSNAIKFTNKPRGEIRVGCAARDGFWEFQVADNGLGIEARHFEKIFQPFQTLASRDDQGGTGIGLAVVKKVVELHGGKVWVESTFGAGSTFYFTLPRQDTV